jgi:hypothetical protein
METIIEGDILKFRVPGDVGVLLRDRTFRLLGPDRTPLGELFVDESLSGTTSELERRYLFDEAHRAIMEFDVDTGRVAYLFPGASTVDDEYPGLIDGCVLVDGVWGFVVSVDDALLAGDPVRLPSVLAARSGLAIGQEVEFMSHSGAPVPVRREPHAALIFGGHAALVQAKAVPGDRAVFLLSRGTVGISRIRRAATGSIEDLLSWMGIQAVERDVSPFSLLAAAMGESQPSDRARIAAAFRRRGRLDLAALTETVSLGIRERLSSSIQVLDASRLCVDVDVDVDDVVIELESGERLFATGNPAIGEAPMGLEWRPADTSALLVDSTWCRWLRAVIRAWARAACLGDIVIDYLPDGWHSEFGTGSLLETLERFGEVGSARRFVLPLSDVPVVPRTGLGFQQLVREASAGGIARLTLSASGWLTEWQDGYRIGPTSFSQAFRRIS